MKISYSNELDGFKEYCQLNNLAESTIFNYLAELKKIPHDDPKSYIVKNKHKMLLIYAFRKFLRFQKSIGKITNEELYDQLETFKPPKKKGQTEKMNWYPQDKWEEIITSAPHRCAKIGIYIAFQFGLRLGEIINLRVQDIDFDTEHIHVQSHSNWKPKYGKHRSVPMQSEQVRILKRWIKNRPSELNHDYIIWSGRSKKQISKKTFENWCKKAWPNLKPHDMRRSFAKVLYYNSGKDVFLVCKLLGHESVSTTTGYLGLETKEIKEKYTRAMS